MLDSIALVIGQVVITAIMALLILGFALLVYVASYKLNEYIRSRGKVISRRINKRYRLLIKVKEGLGDADPELDRLIRDSVELDAMIYAYIYDKEAYEKIKKRSARRKAKPTVIPEIDSEKR